MQNSLKIILSESNKQQQDLNEMKDDLGALKFGLAFLQQTTTEIHTESNRQKYVLTKILRKLAEKAEKSEVLQTSVDNLKDCISDMDMDVAALQMSIDSGVVAIQGDIADVDSDVSTAKDCVNATQTSVSGLDTNIMAVQTISTLV